MHVFRVMNQCLVQFTV